MNAELLDPFAQDYPETLTASFNFGHATCLRFNHSGSHVAVGLVDGAVTIWDTATSGIARILKAHTRTVQSLWCVFLTLLSRVVLYLVGLVTVVIFYPQRVIGNVCFGI
jgi:WD40 repeat protein